MPRRTQRRPASLRRRRHVVEPRRRFYLYCEGTRTEPAYFEALRRTFDNAQVLVTTTGVGGVPGTVAEQAIRRARDIRGSRRRRASRPSSFEESDEVWAVFDRDDHPDFGQAVASCRDSHVGVAQSNPCFELWLVLHFEPYDRPSTTGDAQGRLHELMPAYHHRRSPAPSFTELLAELPHAEQRADGQAQTRLREQRPNGNPSTTVFHLTRAIREADRAARRPD